MLVNNNRVYSSKLACLLSPCPTLGSRWCNVTAQFQHLPSLSNTGPGVPSRLGHVRNVVVCDTLATGRPVWVVGAEHNSTHPRVVELRVWRQMRRDQRCLVLVLVPAQTIAYSLSHLSACLVTRLAWPLQPRWSCGLEDWKTLLLILLLSLDWTVWTNIGVTGSPTYCTAPLPPSSVSRRHV